MFAWLWGTTEESEEVKFARGTFEKLSESLKRSRSSGDLSTDSIKRRRQKLFYECLMHKFGFSEAEDNGGADDVETAEEAESADGAKAADKTKTA